MKLKVKNRKKKLVYFLAIGGTLTLATVGTVTTAVLLLPSKEGDGEGSNNNDDPNDNGWHFEATDKIREADVYHPTFSKREMYDIVTLADAESEFIFTENASLTTEVGKFVDQFNLVNYFNSAKVDLPTSEFFNNIITLDKTNTKIYMHAGANTGYVHRLGIDPENIEATRDKTIKYMTFMFKFNAARVVGEAIDRKVEKINDIQEITNLVKEINDAPTYAEKLEKLNKNFLMFNAMYLAATKEELFFDKEYVTAELERELFDKMENNYIFALRMYSSYDFNLTYNGEIRNLIDLLALNPEAFIKYQYKDEFLANNPAFAFMQAQNAFNYELRENNKNATTGMRKEHYKGMTGTGTKLTDPFFQYYSYIDWSLKEVKNFYKDLNFTGFATPQDAIKLRYSNDLPILELNKNNGEDFIYYIERTNFAGDRLFFAMEMHENNWTWLEVDTWFKRRAWNNGIDINDAYTDKSPADHIRNENMETVVAWEGDTLYEDWRKTKLEAFNGDLEGIVFKPQNSYPYRVRDGRLVRMLGRKLEHDGMTVVNSPISIWNAQKDDVRMSPTRIRAQARARLNLLASTNALEPGFFNEFERRYKLWYDVDSPFADKFNSEIVNRYWKWTEEKDASIREGKKQEMLAHALTAWNTYNALPEKLKGFNHYPDNSLNYFNTIIVPKLTSIYDMEVNALESGKNYFLREWGPLGDFEFIYRAHPDFNTDSYNFLDVFQGSQRNAGATASNGTTVWWNGGALSALHFEHEYGHNIFAGGNNALNSVFAYDGEGVTMWHQGWRNMDLNHSLTFNESDVISALYWNWYPIVKDETGNSIEWNTNPGGKLVTNPRPFERHADARNYITDALTLNRVADLLMVKALYELPKEKWKDHLYVQGDYERKRRDGTPTKAQVEAAPYLYFPDQKIVGLRALTDAEVDVFYNEMQANKSNPVETIIDHEIMLSQYNISRDKVIGTEVMGDTWSASQRQIAEFDPYAIGAWGLYNVGPNFDQAPALTTMNYGAINEKISYEMYALTGRSKYFAYEISNDVITYQSPSSPNLSKYILPEYSDAFNVALQKGYEEQMVDQATYNKYISSNYDTYFRDKYKEAWDIVNNPTNTLNGLPTQAWVDSALMGLQMGSGLKNPNNVHNNPTGDKEDNTTRPWIMATMQLSTGQNAASSWTNRYNYLSPINLSNESIYAYFELMKKHQGDGWSQANKDKNYAEMKRIIDKYIDTENFKTTIKYSMLYKYDLRYWSGNMFYKMLIEYDKNPSATPDEIINLVTPLWVA